MRAVNMTLNSKFTIRIDLTILNLILPDVKYDRSVFNAAIHKDIVTKTTCLIFESGSVTMVGATSFKKAKTTLLRLMKTLKVFYPDIGNSDLVVRNKVWTNISPNNHDLPKSFKKIIESGLFTYVNYEPELFCGLILKQHKLTAMLFRSGKCIITGCTKKKEMLPFFELFQNLLE